MCQVGSGMRDGMASSPGGHKYNVARLYMQHCRCPCGGGNWQTAQRGDEGAVRGANRHSPWQLQQIGQRRKMKQHNQPAGPHLARAAAAGRRSSSQPCTAVVRGKLLPRGSMFERGRGGAHAGTAGAAGMPDPKTGTLVPAPPQAPQAARAGRPACVFTGGQEDTSELSSASRLPLFAVRPELVDPEVCFPADWPPGSSPVPNFLQVPRFRSQVRERGCCGCC